LGGLGISYEGVELTYESHAQQATPRRLDDELRDVLLEVGDLCARSDRKGVILRYDEFHVVEEKRGTTTISALLSAVATAQQRGLPVMLILCGLPPIVEHLVQAKSYSERMFTPERLANLRPAEASAALIDPAAAPGREFEPAAIARNLGGKVAGDDVWGRVDHDWSFHLSGGHHWLLAIIDTLATIAMFLYSCTLGKTGAGLMLAQDHVGGPRPPLRRRLKDR